MQIEASIVDGIGVIPVSSLNQVVAYLNKSIKINPEKFNSNELINSNQVYNLDF